MIPDDWSVRRIGEVCGFIVPGRNKPRHFDGEIPWVTTPDLEDGRSVSVSRIGLRVTRAEAQSIGSRVVPVGSVLMSCAGDLGITAITRNEIVINQQLHAFLPSSQINAIYLLNAITSQKPQIAGLATKTAVPYLNKNNFNSIVIPVPPVAEQEAIAETLSDADAPSNLWSNSSPRNATSNKAPYRSCSPARGACRALKSVPAINRPRWA